MRRVEAFCIGEANNLLHVRETSKLKNEPNTTAQRIATRMRPGFRRAGAVEARSRFLHSDPQRERREERGRRRTWRKIRKIWNR